MPINRNCSLLLLLLLHVFYFSSMNFFSSFLSFPLGAWLTCIKILEPEKCSAWEWASWNELKTEGEAQLRAESNHTGRELFLPLLSLIEQRPEFSV